MPTFGAPVFLAAGLLAAALPVVLHLLRQRPAARQPLPTARFLTPEPRSRLRLAAPDQPMLLAARMLLLILVAAAFAAPGWMPSPSGRGQIVLVDGAAARNPETWRRAVTTARSRAEPQGVLIVFDSTARRLDPRVPATAPIATGRSRLSAALSAIGQGAAGLPDADSLRVVLVSPLLASEWDAGTASVRAAAWPGRIEVVDVGDVVLPQRPSHAPRTARVIAAPGGGGYVRAALAATGFAEETGSGDVILVLRPLSATERATLEGRARAGAAVVLDARSLVGAALPGSAALYRDGEDPVAGADGRVAMAVRPGEHVVGVWEDGRPAAVAARTGLGCLVRFGARLEGGALALSAGFPRLVEGLATACAPKPAVDGRLDPGARRILAGSGPEWVSSAALGHRGAIPLWRWALGLAIVAALMETLLARRAERVAR